MLVPRLLVPLELVERGEERPRPASPSSSSRRSSPRPRPTAVSKREPRRGHAVRLVRRLRGREPARVGALEGRVEQVRHAVAVLDGGEVPRERDQVPPEAGRSRTSRRAGRRRAPAGPPRSRRARRRPAAAGRSRRSSVPARCVQGLGHRCLLRLRCVSRAHTADAGPRTGLQGVAPARREGADVVDEAERGRAPDPRRRPGRRARDRAGAAHRDRGLLAPDGGVRPRPRRRPEVAPLAEADLERRRTTSGLAPAGARPDRGARARPSTPASWWWSPTPRAGCCGAAARRRTADGRRLGFVGGSAWTEANVGTNAIGTALVLGEAVQIRGRRALRRVAHPLGLRRGAPRRPVDRRDPRGRRRERAVPGPAPGRARAGRAGRPADVAGARGASTATDARPAAQPCRPDARAADRAGAGRRPRRAPRRWPPASRRRTGSRCPSGLGVGEIWLPTLGAATAEALPGGWLLRLGGPRSAGPPGDGGRPDRQPRGAGDR